MSPFDIGFIVAIWLISVSAALLLIFCAHRVSNSRSDEMMDMQDEIAHWESQR